MRYLRAFPDGTYAIVTGYNEEETNSVVVSPLYNGLSVKEIKASAFEGCADLTSVTLPLSITAIGENAFYGCTSLMGIYLRKSIATVGANAFYGCLDLKIFCEAESAPEGFSVINRLLWNDGFSSPDKNAILIYHCGDNTHTYAPPTIYCTEVRAVPKYN